MVAFSAFEATSCIINLSSLENVVQHYGRARSVVPQRAHGQGLFVDVANSASADGMFIRVSVGS